MDLRFPDPTPRRFVVKRHTDISGMSGTGLVASGCVFPDGTTVVHWNTAILSTTIFGSFEDMVLIHGHNGATEVVLIDSAFPIHSCDDAALGAVS